MNSDKERLLHEIGVIDFVDDRVPGHSSYRQRSHGIFKPLCPHEKSGHEGIRHEIWSITHF